jgi:putative nucleotidyltransferase with HDIG domain
MRRVIATQFLRRRDGAPRDSIRSTVRAQGALRERQLWGQGIASRGRQGGILNHLFDKIDRLADQLQRAESDCILALVAAVEARDPYTRRHSINVATMARTLARRMGRPRTEIEDLVVAALLHDIGKLAVPDAILHKPGPLTAEEFDLITEHPVAGAAMLRPAGFLNRVVPLVLHHHEWYDGTGYPHGVKGERIPLGARILQVADCIDAMMTPRSYKRSLGVEEVIQEFRRYRGRQFDPAIADVAIDWLSGRGEPLRATADDDRQAIPFPVA